MLRPDIVDLKKLLIALCTVAGIAAGAGSSAALEPPPAPAPQQPQKPAEPTPPPSPVALGETVVLKSGQTAEVASKDISIRFTELVSDSRCPQGMVCIWAGEAVVELAMAEPGRGERTTAELATTGRGGKQSVEFAACRVDLVAVSSGGDQVTLRVSRA